MRRFLSLSCVLAALTLGACQDAPLAPDVGPQFLIGNSPLTPITLDTSDPAQPRLTFGVLVNRGITQVAIEDKFLVRVSGGFKLPDGSDAGTVEPKDHPVTGQKDTGVRQGSDVGFIMDMDIPAPVWDVIEDYNGVLVKLDAKLIMTDGSGTEHVLDAVTLAGTVDPKGSPNRDATVTAGPLNEPNAIDSETSSWFPALDFTLSDGGGGDLLATQLSEIVVRVTGSADAVDFGWQLAGPDVAPTLGAIAGSVGSQTVSFSALTISIADGASEVYTVSVWPVADPIATADGDVLRLAVDETDILWTAGTRFADTSPVTNGDGLTYLRY